MNQGV
jgi:hypothetical protein